MNTAGRMMFTFLPAFAHGTGFSVQAMSRIISARDMAGLAAPLLAAKVKQIGTWSAMTWAGLAGALAMGVTLLGPYGVVVGLCLWGLARTAYLVSASTWIADAVAYERRGRAIGLMELTWAGAALAGLPLMGLLIDRVGWWAAPSLLSLVGVPVSFYSWRLGNNPNGDAVSANKTTAEPDSTSPHKSWTVTKPTTIALIGFSLQAAAAQFIFVTHGLWLSDTYGFNPAKAGAAIMVIGLAEAASSSASSIFTDRLGKRNAVIAGTSVMIMSFIVLAVAPSPPLIIGLIVLAVAFLGFEFSIVSSMPLIGELEPHNRSTTIGLSAALLTSFRATVTLIGGQLYVYTSFSTVMAAATGTGVIGLLTTWLLVSEP